MNGPYFGPCTTIRQYRDRDQDRQNRNDAELEAARQEADSFSFGPKRELFNTRLTGRANMHFEEPLREDELDGSGALFGWKFSEGGSNGLVSIYIEDDENWHRKMTFDVAWLPDFKNMALQLEPQAK